jgi:hypothetical protein
MIANRVGACVLTIVLAGCGGGSEPPAETPAPPSSPASTAPSTPSAPPRSDGRLAPEQEQFWNALQSHCGNAYAGRVDDVTEYYREGLEGKALIAHFRECTPDRIHIALHENDDRSRNWILTLADGTIRLKHDHRHEDGTEDAVTQYGGDAPAPGLPERQIFRADQHTAEILPLRADNFWFLHFVDEGRTLHYGVHWPTLGHSVRLAFDLSTPIAAPPPPWGYQ